MWKTKHVSSLCRLGALLAPSLVAPRSSQAQYANQVEQQLTAIEVVARMSDYRRTHEYQIDVLANEAAKIYRVTLRGGWQYQIASVCDRDCSDLDIEVFDADGHLVEIDDGPDDIPIVAIRPDRTGRYTVRTTMNTCRQQPCYYGVGVFGRQRARGVAVDLVGT